MGPKNLIFAIVLGSALAAGTFVAMKMNEPAELQTAFAIPLPNALPDFSLLNQAGQAVNAESFRGQWDLVFFGFTNCPDVCPTTLQVLASVRRELKEAGAKSLPRIVLVSVDPERDTPEILGQYVDYFGEGNLGVTGGIEGIRTLTAALGIYFEKAPTSDTDYGVDHSAAVLVINPDGEFSALFRAPHIIANYVHDLPIIMGRN
jgi:protein SCO1/2